MLTKWRFIKKYKYYLKYIRDFEKQSFGDTQTHSLLVCVAMFVLSIIGLSMGLFYKSFTNLTRINIFKSHGSLAFCTLILLIVYFTLVNSNYIGKNTNLKFSLSAIWQCILCLIFNIWGAYISFIYLYRVDNQEYNYILWLTTLMLVSCMIYIRPRYHIILVIINEIFMLYIVPKCANYQISSTDTYNLLLLGIVCYLWMVIRYFSGLKNYVQHLTIETLIKERENLLISMAHDMRTPLNVIIGKCTILEHISTEQKILSISKDIELSSKMILSRVNDIMDITKLEENNITIKNQIYKPLHMANEIYNIFDSESKNHNLVLYKDFSKNIPNILKGDETRIKQVITNLMGNAIKYTRKGFVTFYMDFIKLSETEGKLVIKIQDTGIGIKSEDFSKLTQRYKRLDEEKNQDIQGSGLGLSIVEKILSLMDSKLNVESTYGKGSIFSFCVKQEIVNEETSIEEEHIEYKDYSNIRALVVDDINVNCIIASQLLDFYKITTDSANSGKECLSKLAKQKYDIIFIDHLMPDLDGGQTLEKIKTEYPKIYEEVPIIALTGDSYKGAKENYIKIGFTDFISKPIDKNGLHQILLNNLKKIEIRQT